jgi:predicted Zn-dependent protease
VILEPRANARFLSLMTGIFGGGGGGRGGGGGGGRFGGGGGGGDAPPDSTAGGGGGRGGGGGGGAAGLNAGGNTFLQGKKVGDKVFSDLFTLKSDVGNPILRQTPILGDNRPAKAVTWIDKGILSAVGPQQANVNMSLSMEGSNLSIEDMIKQTRRGLLVTFFWYIRGVPAQGQPLLNTGMTRDGLFLIENGEIVGPVQNFRWNMSPLVGYNNLSLVGKPGPMHTGESYDGGGTALVPPVRIEEFYMTSVSPAVSP